MLIPRKPRRKKSRVDYVRYDTLHHQLYVSIYEQNFTYIGVPDSMYARLLQAETPDEIFMNEIFNKYPVVINGTPKPPRLRKHTAQKTR